MITTALVGTVIAVATFLVRRRGLATGFVLSDTQSIGDLPWYAGALSNAGIVMWVVTAAVAIFGSRLAEDRETRGFLLSGGLLSSLLGFDARGYRDRLDQSPAALTILDFATAVRARLRLFNDTSHYDSVPQRYFQRGLSRWWSLQ